MSSIIDSFLAHPVWRDTRLERLIPLAERATELGVARHKVLFRRFHPADDFWLLFDGQVGHEIASRDELDAPPVASVSWQWAALGWSGFLPPHRYGTTAHTSTTCTFLRWRHEDLANCFYADPELSVNFFRIVVESVRRQFETVRSQCVAAGRGYRKDGLRADPDAVPRRKPYVCSVQTTLRRSAFFEQFDDVTLTRLARDSELIHCEPGTHVLSQNQPTAGLWVLAAGTAVSHIESDTDPRAAPVPFQTLTGCGAVLGGAPTHSLDYRAETTVIAASACSVYRIPAESIERLVRADPEFGRSYMQRTVSRLANWLSIARVSRTMPSENPEFDAVKALLQQNQARIPVNSELHKIPHLLSHRLTIGNAFASLHTVREIGRYEERSIARTAEGLLAGVRAELHFYRDVLDSYVAVVDAPFDADPERLREACDAGLANAFEHLDFEIRGWRHLPHTSGHIFIMNHLCCPAYYQFPNGYHFSFDTAFVSVLLNKRYGSPPIRVVRQSPGKEYGHSLFYSRLGHITVPTVESGATVASDDTLERLRRESAGQLFTRGRHALAQRRNLLICPEGQSQRAYHSPAKFYSGAFRLAQRVNPEPYIVPIALAGFDKRYKETKLVAKVLEPFRMSERLHELGSENLREFLDDYRLTFAAAVRKAQTLSTKDSPADAASSRRGGFTLRQVASKAGHASEAAIE